MTFLEFKDVSIVGRKTELYEVYSAHSKEFLGLIGWRNGWRRYVMSFKGGCDWSIECMAECYKFVTKLMQDRIGCGSVKEEDSVSRQLKKGDTQVVRGSTPFAASDAPSKAQEPIGCEKGRAEKVCRLPEKGNAEKRVVRLKSLPPSQVPRDKCQYEGWRW